MCWRWNIVFSEPGGRGKTQMQRAGGCVMWMMSHNFCLFLSRGKCAYFSCTNFVTNLCRVTVIKRNELTIRKLRSCCLLNSQHTPNISWNTSSYVAYLKSSAHWVWNIERRRTSIFLYGPEVAKKSERANVHTIRSLPYLFYFLNRLTSSEDNVFIKFWFYI